MPTLTFFIVFHKELYEKNTSSFTEDELQEWFAWVAVNEKISKKIPSWLSTKPLLYEYKMENHCPLYQMLNFYQNSVFFHLNENRQYVKGKYIGFGQYDMSIQAEAIRQVVQMIESTGKNLLFSFFPYPIQVCFDILNQSDWDEVFFKPYAKFRGKNITLQDIQDYPVSLLHTFIIPRHVFFSMMDFTRRIYPRILQKLNWDTRHLAGTLERAFAFFLNCQLKEGELESYICVKGIEHLDTQHSEDSLRGIAAGKEASQ